MRIKLTELALICTICFGLMSVFLFYGLQERDQQNAHLEKALEEMRRERDAIMARRLQTDQLIEELQLRENEYMIKQGYNARLVGSGTENDPYRYEYFKTNKMLVNE